MRRTLLALALAATTLTGCSTDPTVAQVEDVPGGIVYVLGNGDVRTCTDFETVTGTECTGNAVEDIPADMCPEGFRVDGLAVRCGWV